MPRVADVLRAILAALLLTTALADHDAAAQERAITIVLPEEPDIVDPCHASRSNIGRIVKQNVAETLTEIDPKDGSVRPRLATSWEQVDEKTWRFKLKEGVKFHDGTPFDAEAAVASINRTLNPKLDCEIRIKFFGSTKVTPKAIDATTLEVQTEGASPIMPVMMGTMTVVPPSTAPDQLTREPVGTGPYTFTSWRPGQDVVLTRFDGYWGDKPQVRKATYVWRSEPALRASMVEVGEADIALQIAPQDAVNKETDIGYLNADTSRIRFFMDKPPLNDRRVREAMNLAIDRGAFIGTIVSPLSVPASQFMLANVNGYDPSLKPWPYDLKKAQALIKEARAAGVPVDKEIALYGSEFMQANLSEMLETLAQSWQEIGLNVKVMMVDKIQHSAIRRKPYPTDRGPTMVHELHDNVAGDAFYTMIVYYTSNGGLTNIYDPNLDKLLQDASVSTGDQRREMFQHANRIIQQEIVPDVMLFHMVSYIRVGKRVSYQPDFTTQGKLELSAITFK